MSKSARPLLLVLGLAGSASSSAAASVAAGQLWRIRAARSQKALWTLLQCAGQGLLGPVDAFVESLQHCTLSAPAIESEHWGGQASAAALTTVMPGAGELSVGAPGAVRCRGRRHTRAASPDTSGDRKGQKDLGF